jgi:hypothetical protein
MSVGCGTVVVQPCHSQHTHAIYQVPFSAASPEDEHVMLETCRGPWFSINWMKSAWYWFRYTDAQVLSGYRECILRQLVNYFYCMAGCTALPKEQVSLLSVIQVYIKEGDVGMCQMSLIIIIIIIIIIFINCKWVDTRWQWSFYILHMHGLWRSITLDLVGEGYMGSM